MKTKLTLLFLAIIISGSTFAYNYLQINNPQSWGRYNGVINNAEITVRPVGGFVEYELTLTISGQQPINESADAQLEIVLYFDLPSNSMITDSWLWINDVPQQADILDRWTASAIYEEIVNRRKDPSLLVKEGANQYKMSVYPMKPTESRKFKMVYLSPAKYLGKNLVVEIPSNILKLSTTNLSKVSTYIIPNDFFGEPKSDNSKIKFSSATHPDFGACTKVDIHNEAFSNHGILLTANDEDQIKIAQYGDDTEGYYQLSFVPSDLVPISDQSKKICYMVDFDKNYTTQDPSTFLSKLAQNIQSTIGEQDYFNVIFSKISPSPYFSEWMPATAENIEMAFSNSTVVQYSNLISLLGTGLDFVNKNGDGSLVLVTNNCTYNSIEGANEILADIKKLNVNQNAINIIDFAESHYYYTWTSNSYYYNDGYLFTNLSRQNSGEYISFYSNYNGSNFYSLLEEAVDLVAGQKINNIDIYTGNENGFCYARINVSNTLSNSFTYNKPIHHLGKYSGGMPTNLELAFEMNGELYHYQADLRNYKVMKDDSIVKTVWNGLDMFNLEKQGYSNLIVNEIIGRSIENRILSNYTAFLCVEQPVETCDDCGEVQDPDNGEVITEVDKQKLTESIKTYPNPFTTQIQIELPSNEEVLELKIYNISGQCVKTFEVEANQYAFFWDGTDDNGNQLKDGIYLIKAVYQNNVITTKVMKK